MHGRPLALPLLVCACLLAALPASARVAEGDVNGARAIGDTLTVVMRPILSVPVIIEDGQSFTIEAKASSGTYGWSAAIERGGLSYPLVLSDVAYESARQRWFMTATVAPGTPEELYDLHIQASGGVDDVTKHSVMVEASISNDYYFVHITDTHLPTHLYYDDNGSASDTTEMDDLRAVIDDINIINPAFVLFTGDVINEGELEEFENRRYFTKTKRLLGEFEVPVFLGAGNHDIGGWDSTPPPDGTARRNWWKFFGWPYLYDPPTGDNIYTQNYFFDYGHAHFVGLESYVNYDDWRQSRYGDVSFTTKQMAWLEDHLSQVHPIKAVVLFYHMDFDDEIDLDYLGVDGAVYGHIHHDSGSIGATPFNIATDNVCDGNRAMRLFRVSDNTVTPTETISAGGGGGYNLRVTYDAANDGTETDVTATVINGLNESFEHARLKFHVPAASMPYAVNGGTVTHSIVDGAVATYYVHIDLDAMSGATVSISPETGVAEVFTPSLALMQSFSPSPARASSSVRYSLGTPAHVTAELFDASGRRVVKLRDEWTPAGTQILSWNLRDESGHRVSSGAYFLRIVAGDEAITDRVTVLR